MTKLKIQGTLAGLLCLLLLAGIGYYVTGTHLTGRLREELAKDPRNQGAKVSLEGRDGDMVLDVREVPGSFSMADMDRILFVAAEIADKEAPKGAGTTVLAYKGAPRFQLTTADFKELGREYAAEQNPVYLIRVLTKQVRDTQGRLAFEPVEGGWLGVLGVEMENHNELHQRWWIDSATSGVR